MRNLSLTLGLGVLMTIFLGLNPVSGQSITCTQIGSCESGSNVIYEFSSFPDILVEKLNECKEDHEDMFVSFEVLHEAKAVQLEVAYDDFSCDDLTSWLDSWLEKWNSEFHEDMLAN